MDIEKPWTYFPQNYAHEAADSDPPSALSFAFPDQPTPTIPTDKLITRCPSAPNTTIERNPSFANSGKYKTHELKNVGLHNRHFKYHKIRANKIPHLITQKQLTHNYSNNMTISSTAKSKTHQLAPEFCNCQKQKLEQSHNPRVL